VIHGSTAEELDAILSLQRGLLTAEIRVLKPTAVIFFTGPDYDVALRDEFPELSMRPLFDRTEREFARLSHPELPSETFRTYHPNFLRRRKKWEWLDDICGLVAQAEA
jgi:hypothetical protein